MLCLVFKSPDFICSHLGNNKQIVTAAQWDSNKTTLFTHKYENCNKISFDKNSAQKLMSLE